MLSKFPIVIQSIVFAAGVALWASAMLSLYRGSYLSDINAKISAVLVLSVVLGFAHFKILDEGRKEFEFIRKGLSNASVTFKDSITEELVRSAKLVD